MEVSFEHLFARLSFVRSLANFNYSDHSDLDVHILLDFANINKDENYELSLSNLAKSKNIIFEFFDNVIVNDDDQSIKKNRLELLQMLCKTFDNYINFSNIESV